MTLDLTHSAWQDRIRACNADRDTRFHDYEQRVRKLAGPAHKSTSGWEGGDFDPINFTLATVQQLQAQLAYGLPRAKVGSRRESGRTLAEQSEAMLNRLISQSEVRKLNEMLVLDLALDYSITRTDSEPAPGFSEWDDPPFHPSDKRIAPWDLLYDQQAYETKLARYFGDRGTRDIEDVLDEAESDPSWNKDVLEQVHGRMVEHPREVKDAQVTPMAEDRMQFRYWRIYCPEVTADDLRALGVEIDDHDEQGRQYNAKGGYHGAEFTVLDPDEGRTNDDTFIRKPRMWWGPRGGPYTFCVGQYLPNDLLGLSMDTASRGQQKVANDVLRACLNAIEDGKSFALVGSADAGFAQTIQGARNGGTYVLQDVPDDIKKRVTEVSVGFLTPELLTAHALTLDLAQKATGIGPSQLGEETPGVTATQTAVAASATGAKVGFWDVKFREFQAERLRKWLWYIVKDQRFVLVMPDEIEPETGQPVKPIAVGGNSQWNALKQAARMDPQIPGQVEGEALLATGQRHKFEDILAAMKAEEDADPERDAGEDEIDRLDLSIDPLSMSRTAEGIQQARMQTQISTLPVMLQMAAQFPFWDWEDQFREWGDMMNVPGVDRRLNVEKLAMFQQLTMGAAFADPAGEQKPPEPRVAKDKAPSSFGKPAQPAGAGGGMQGRSTGALAGAASKPAGGGAKPMKMGAKK